MIRKLSNGRHKRITISVVTPCFNEEESIEKCIKEAEEGIKEALRVGRRSGGETGEIVVVDNGSTDGSMEVVRKTKFKKVNIRLIQERKKGYGAALLRGFEEARGEIVVMGDSDGTYDFREIPKLVKPILNGSLEVVLGSRIKGRQEKGAMPALHRYLGTPVLTFLVNVLFDLKLSDSQSGFRAVLTESYRKLGMRMKGMEFASEMLVRAKRAKQAIGEVPVSYRRRAGESKLVPFADAWRHIRFLLLFSPGRLFTVPGVLLFLVGLIFFALTAPAPIVFGRGVLDVHTLSLSGMAMLLGFQLLSLGMFSRVYGKYSFGVVEDDFVDFFIEKFQLEQGLRAGTMIFLVGFVILGWIIGGWALAGFPALSQVRPVLVGTVLVMLGAQMIFGSFFLSFLRGEGR